MPSEELTKLRFYGTVQPTANFQITVPVRAREELRLTAQEPLFLFGSPAQRRVILTASPPAAELLELIGQRHSAEGKRSR